MIRDLAPPPAIIIQADRFEILRCRCPICRVLDARYPRDGFQLSLFQYRAWTRGMEGIAA